MPKKTFSEKQIAFALQRAEGGTAIGEICRNMNIAEATLNPIGVPAGIGLDAQRRLG